MAESREQFLWRLREAGWAAWDREEGKKGHVDEALTASVEAGYIAALRDVYALTRDDFGGNATVIRARDITALAKERGIDLEDTP